MANKKSANHHLAAIEYHGIAGSSLDCEAAVVGLINSGRAPIRGRILSAKRAHCLLLTDQTGDFIAIKSGFTSGYGGTGPTCFSHVLQLLETHGCELSESEHRATMLDRLDQSALTSEDLKTVLNTKPRQPNRVYDFIREQHFTAARKGTLWDDVSPTVPFALIDPRLFELSISFSERPDEALLAGYRTLEDRVRERTKIKDHGQGLFSKAFREPDAPLHWKGIDDGERIGRVNLFTGAYMAHRNPRAHRRGSQPTKSLLSEFLLLNHLFRLEGEARGPRRKRKVR